MLGDGWVTVIAVNALGCFEDASHFGFELTLIIGLIVNSLEKEKRLLDTYIANAQPVDGGFINGY